MALDPGQTLLPYREDHIGLTRSPLLIAVGLTVVAIVLAVPAIGGTVSCFVLRRSVFYVY